MRMLLARVFAYTLALSAGLFMGCGSDPQFIQISAGAEHTCGLRPDGSAVCWGSNEWDQLLAPSDERLTAIEAGAAHTCGLRSNGTSVCWGYGEESGAETIEALDPYYSPPFPPEDIQFKSISAGDVTCGLTADGVVVCWEQGWKFRGEYLPFGTEQVVELSAGVSGVCGLRPDGSAICHTFGENPPEEERFVSISVSLLSGCGLRSNGTVLCWGDDSWGQLSPHEGEVFSEVTTGAFHTCGLRPDGTAVCWGYDLERASEVEKSSPGYIRPGMGFLFDSPRIEVPEGEQFDAIDAGFFHTCGLREDGGVSCWGYNHQGQASPPDDPR